ncbi:MAG: flagellar filament capping protein FliD [Phycisphaerae bacterium]|nr:flagellar filament capping protein FliD [Phycisphaerae bacterium]
MSTISSSVGLISGLPIADLVDGLIAAQRRPITLIDTRLGELTALRTALVDISARVAALKGFSAIFKRSDFFQSAAATSSHENLIRAVASAGASPGTYSFRVRQLASTHQVVSTGFATRDSTYLNPGTLTIESALGRLDRSTPLSLVRGGQGVRGGVIRVTDRSGASADVDLTAARSVEDVLLAINNQSSVEVTARVSGDRIVLEDATGLASGNLIVADVGAGRAASDLGLAGSDATGRIDSADLVSLSGSLRLESLNDGNGVRRTSAGADFRIGLANGLSFDVDLSGRLSPQTTLGVLNNGAGVAAGSIEITNRAGASATVDLSGAHTIDDVLTAINTAGVGVTAALVGGGILLTDSSGGSGSLTVAEVGGGTTARDLGIAGSSTTAALTGSTIHRIETLGDVLRAINGHVANTGLLTASISADGDHVVLTDQTSGGGALQVTALNGSRAADDLGLTSSVAGGAITSRRLLAGLDSVLLGSLNGGKGITTGVIRVTDRAGATADVDVSGAASLSEIIEAINAAGTGVRVSLSDSGLGLAATDTSGGGGALVIEDVSGATAEGLRIAVNAATSLVRSGNLQRQYISETTRLDRLGGGAGVPRGKFRITNAAGQSAVVDLTQGNEVTVADVIAEINSRGIQVTARINDGGDGILLEDESGGAGSLRVAEEEGGATASALRIRGTAAPGSNTIDGSFETRVTVGANDTLDTLLQKIQASGAAVNAAVFNDGSAGQPFRLSLTSTRSGVAGRLAIDAEAIGLGFSALSRGRDAVLEIGGGADATPLVLGSSTNTFDNTIAGLRLDLLGAGPDAVTISVSRDIDAIVRKLDEFTQGLNAVLGRIDDLSKFNTQTNARGVLLGDRSAEQVRSRLTRLLTREIALPNGGSVRLSSYGFSFANGRLAFDAERFRRAYEADPQAVSDFFTTAETGFAAALEREVDGLTGADGGALTRRQEALSQTEESLNQRRGQLEVLLEKRRDRLTAQFFALERALAQLQSQRNALSSLSSGIASLGAASSAGRA